MPLPDKREQKYLGVKWLQIRTDLMSSYYYWKKGELTIRDYFKSVQGKKFFAVFSFKDPKPFLAEIATGLKMLFDGLRRKNSDPNKISDEELEVKAVSSSLK